MIVQSLIKQIILNCKRNPTKIALKGDDVELSYGALLELAKDYANGIKNEELTSNWVGIDTALGWQCYPAILGCWMAGKGYLPLNFTFPERRIQSIIRSSSVEAVISETDQNDLKRILPQPGLEGYETEGKWSYLIYTSGTTGEPKGVPIQMKNLSSFVNHYQNHKKIKLSTTDVFLQSYELTFDVSVFCFLIAFVNSATLVLPTLTKSKQLGLFKAIQDYNVTVTSFVPSVIRLTKDFLPRVQFPQLRYSFFSGEALMGEDAKVWMNSVPNSKVYNCYGPTETVIVCTEELLNELDDAYFNNGLPLPLGDKFDGVDLQLVHGEIIFSGAQTFEGYLNEPLITDFPSGDLAHYDVKGKLLFDGRKDNQIQWNGYRIELEELDAVLSLELNTWVKSVYLKSIEKLVVVTPLNETIVQEQIKLCFPRYYKPSLVLKINSLPLNINGKLNINKLKKIVQDSV